MILFLKFITENLLNDTIHALFYNDYVKSDKKVMKLLK